MTRQGHDKRRLRRNKRFVLGLLLIVAIWPLLHRGLVVEFQLNPWKLGGFAMYATATPPLRVIVFRNKGGGVAPLDERRLPAAIREELTNFRIRRHALGRLHSADDVGRSILGALPEIDWIVVSIQRMTIDPETARMRSSRNRYRYPQDSGQRQLDRGESH